LLEVVSQFKYLGSMFTSDGMLDTEIAHRVADANSASARLHKGKIWLSKGLSMSTKLQFVQTIVMMLYGGETWSLLDKHHSALSVFHMRCLTQVCGISMRDHVTNQDMLKQCESFSVDSQPRLKRVRWIGHVCRMPDSRLSKCCCMDRY